MDNISEQHYERVLQYMQEEHIENYQDAYKIMSQHNFDIDLARLNSRNQQGAHQISDDNQQYQENQPEQQAQQLSRMQSYLLKKSSHRNNRHTRPNLFGCLRNCLSITCMRMTERFLPQMIKRSIIRSEFYNLYQDHAVIQLNSRKLQQGEQLAKISKKKLFVIVSGKNRNKAIRELLRKKKVLQKLQQDYQIIGLIHNQFCSQAKNLGLPHTVTALNPPFVLVFRERQIQSLELVHQYTSEQQIEAFNQQRLKQLNEKIKGCVNRQASLLRRIRERILGNQMNSGIGFGDRIQDEQNQRANQFIANRRQSKLIAQQNQQYLQMQKKNKEIQQQNRQKQIQLSSIIQERQCRKLSIPDEPQQNQENGSKIVKVIFRCPNGQSISRKFYKNEQCELLYNWVELNDEIEFQGDQFHQLEQKNQRKNSSGRVVIGQRNFDLFHSYPPQSLKEKVSMQLGEIFEDEDQVKILIREL